MGWACWLAAIGWAEEPTARPSVLVIDAKVPAEVRVDGTHAATLLVPSTLSLVTTPGSHELMVWVHGTPRELTVDLPLGEQVVVVIGSGGITAGAPPRTTDAGPVRVEIRSTGVEALVITLGGTRVVVDAGATVPVDVPVGEIPLTMRNMDGTVIWADGTLVVAPGAMVVIQISDGRAPEVAGVGSAWRPKS